MMNARRAAGVGQLHLRRRRDARGAKGETASDSVYIVERWRESFLRIISRRLVCVLMSGRSRRTIELQRNFDIFTEIEPRVFVEERAKL